MRTSLVVGSLVALALPISIATPGAGAAGSAGPEEYVVLYRAGASQTAARQAIRQAGGLVVRENTDVGVATVTSGDPDFLVRATAAGVIEGVAHNRVIGSVPPQSRPKADVERVREAVASRIGQSAPAAAAAGPEPLAPLQWDMAMIRATSGESYAVQRGDRRVIVGIIDTGIDGAHPDIAPNFNGALSRNFTTDIPLIDGPCADELDHSCADPPDVDEDGHGTHVAGIVGAAINGLGIAGVAPNVTLVNLRAGQDSGFFFLQQTVDALTFAADHGVDVVNMSFFTDPWLYNCPNNPADTPAEQAEQRTVIAATQRALDYAYAHNVTLIGAAGNENTDLGHPTIDNTSPDYPPGTATSRTVDNSCLVLPTEGHNVISVTALGPSMTKADYSNYGTEQAAVSAPGGYFRDRLGTPFHRTVANLVLSAYPESVGRANGDIDQNGAPTTPFVVRDCNAGGCAYYQYLQGTSMAAPHAAGVAAIAVSRVGVSDFRQGGLFLPAATTQAVLERTATQHDCPTPRLQSYADVGRPPSFDAFCDGTRAFNGFYGYGIVDALGAATLRPRVTI
ncbi:MAG: S8 family peptidase [Acidimicrobiales bacterium]